MAADNPQQSHSGTGTASFTMVQADGTITLAASDVLRVYVYASVSGAWNVTSTLSFFGIEYVGS